MKKVIIIAGPTAVGKTKTAVELAKKLNTQIISCDSMQIYKGMDIGTAKVTEEEKNGIAHHLIDIVEPQDYYSVGSYSEDAQKEISKLFEKNKIPIFAGGTGLYINSVIYKMDFNDTDKDETVRQKYEQYYSENGEDALFALLQEKDINASQKIEKQNIKRVIRALEIAENNDKVNPFEKISEFQDYEVKLYVLALDRKILYERINNRVDKMLENGLVDEVKNLINSKVPTGSTSMKAIGYRQIIDYLDGKTDYQTSVELIKRDSRRYAKRQYTWFRRYAFAKWIDTAIYTPEQIADLIYNEI
ncbi:tRNA (adenosine(37)-N6)-dimethylallyltransferase MiaA [Criibacterium bergeronii]|uniref:tRNA dimethylallyltransferase n=1 Tax=Criibacterium bergeronii TaxID=1871336 RepID=A0A371INW7_9FIRM|nr:tRNA (adenosine(37)-N6)-dimethylallyltransferase MiaA [Criibacterium bergeronii]MBS6062494.1 tRNA (adenosine(37)-N6)-dimethylallyltransferase MiaA [Peptostreptococcaceae bacterium]RDY22126.1 tRNA (adenosine(37)-N6)-dimethylallyltransferase MiaA [Criibacterium bergeronii]